MRERVGDERPPAAFTDIAERQHQIVADELRRLPIPVLGSFRPRVLLEAEGGAEQAERAQGQDVGHVESATPAREGGCRLPTRGGGGWVLVPDKHS